MPQPPTLKISEIFPSLQGEGLRQGEPTIFVRFSGCNLRCSFCDTRYAWQGGREFSIGQVLAIVGRIRRRYPAEWVCLTGGEPLLQDLTGLAARLRKIGLKIQLETNATQRLPFAADWVTISPKPPGFLWQPEFKRRAKEVKLVVTRSLQFRTVERLRRGFPGRVPLLLQPESNARWSTEKVLRILHKTVKGGLKNIRFSPQLHKICGWR